MHTFRLRLAQLALENLPFARSQTRTVLDINAADGATTQFLQYYLPYSTVFGLRNALGTAPGIPLGQRYLTELPSTFHCDCVIAITEPNQPVQALLSRVEAVSARWSVVIAPLSTAQEIDWRQWEYRIHYEITEEPEDGVILVAIRDQEWRRNEVTTPRVLIVSPVRQKPTILKHFLFGLQQLDTAEIETEYLFIDNNEDGHSSQMLREFANQTDAPVRRLRVPVGEPYIRNEIQHQWNESLIWRLAAIKDGALHAALQHGFDYAFLVDSDLVLHPQTLRQMIAYRREIVSQVFWTSWSPDQPPLPNVWYTDFYTLYRVSRSQQVPPEEQRRRAEAFLSALAFQPGLYRVSGLGACTLITRKAIEAGVCFSELRGSMLMGEDRHFCLRAESLGFSLFADSTLPPLHLYRESEVPRVESYWQLVNSGAQGAELNRQMFQLLLGRQVPAA
ncbi:MAG: hypothetical protein KatS3mg016_0211 [Fimbriimonadales bacterium]|nr:MAG: hypothetical protein KatS3mg016_0211 [Fimbriimonadales bacterium]